MKRNILIGLAGGSGSGKTLVARTIVRELGSDKVVVIDQDSYYRDLEHIPFRDREARNFDHPDAFDTALLREHLEALIEGEAIEQPVYDYTQHCRLTETRRISDHRIIVLEGILIFHDPELRALMDIKLFVTPTPTCDCCAASSATSSSAAAPWTRSSSSTRRACARCTCSSSSRPSASPT